MSRKLTITIAIVSSLMAAASFAMAGQKVSDRNYWPREVAANERIAAESRFGRAVIFIRFHQFWAAPCGRRKRQPS